MEDGLHGEGIPLAPRPAELDIKQEDMVLPMKPPTPVFTEPVYTKPERVTSDDVIIPKGQPCNCPNCQASPTGKALRYVHNI